MQLEYASLNENLQSLINDNQILKRVIANQHQRSSENEAKAKEVQHLKGVVGQYQEQVHKLEVTNFPTKNSRNINQSTINCLSFVNTIHQLSNYAMKLHLQRSQQQQQQTSFSGNLPPDVY